MAANNELVQCTKCKHATLMQWFNNPIIAQCSVFNDRQVAESRRVCKEFSLDYNQKDIKHFDCYENKK